MSVVTNLHRGSSHAERMERLQESPPAILPSMLLCDFANLAAEVDKLEQARAPCLHLDVMDGHFVPNLTYGMPMVETFRRLTDLPIDVHLMISNPEKYVEQYVKAGADLVTIHVEAVADARPVLERIRRAGAAPGIALNPPTPLSAIEPLLPLCQHVLVMSVMPGFGGQEFEQVALEKLRALRSRVDGRTLLEVDGGVNTGTIAACGQAGADLFVVGSAIFRHEDYRASVAELRRLAVNARGT